MVVLDLGHPGVKRGIMVIHESYITRKPLEFMLIVLSIILIILLPIYFYTEKTKESRVEEKILVPQTYNEVKYLFSPESDLSESDKRHLFSLTYEGNYVQWVGPLLVCNDLDGVYRVSIDQSGDGFGDVLFTTYEDCTGIPEGVDVTYKIKLIDWKVNSFIGSEGEIIKWD